MQPVFEIFPNLKGFDPKRDFYGAGATMSPSVLLEAYRKGIFPWPDPNFPDVIWASPAERAVLFFDHIHFSKSLRKFFKKTPFTYTINHTFEDVIAFCRAVSRPGQSGTWITPALERAYVDFHDLGFAHSVEVWWAGRLIGGIYGVCIDGVFYAESMFHLESNASKFALVKLVEFLKSKGLKWIDLQVLTPVTASLGACTIPREEFLDLLSASRNPGFKPFQP